MISKRALPRNVDIYRYIDKKQFLQDNLKKHRFCRHVDISEYMDKKRHNVSFLEMLIITDVWTRTIFRNDFKIMSFSPKC